MASIVEKIQQMWNQSDEEYDDYYDEEIEEEQEETPIARDDNAGPSIFKRPNKVISMNPGQKLKVVVYKPISFGQDTRDMANSLIQNNALVLNLEKTKAEEAKRILDFLSGVAFAQKGDVKKVATATFIITPINVELTGEELFDEFENHGVYF